jgi:hypothetical protein
VTCLVRTSDGLMARGYRNHPFTSSAFCLA